VAEILHIPFNLLRSVKNPEKLVLDTMEEYPDLYMYDQGMYLENPEKGNLDYGH
jgi:hypothetical protein